MKYAVFYFLSICLTINYIIAQVASSPLFHLQADQGITKDANDLVSQWQDLGRSITATQTNIAQRAKFVNSSIAGLPALRFNGTNSFMNLPSIFPVNKDYTLVIVCQAFSPTNNIVGGNSRTIWMAGGTTPTMLHNADFNNQVKSSFDPGQEPCIIIAQYRESTKQGSFWANGIFADSAFCPSNVDPAIFIAAYQGGYIFNGDISEIVLYNRYLNSNEINTTQNFLLSKYKIIKPSLPDGSLLEVPQHNQLYPRDEKNICSIPIKGIVKIPGHDSVMISMYEENKLIHHQSQKLIYINGVANYQFQENIIADLVNYRIEILLKKQNKDSLIYVANKICCGDVYIINGQSNSIFGGSPEQNEFCRTFGKNFSNKISDTLWTIGRAIGNGGSNDVGAWGMHLAIRLIQENKIPICIMNGGVGGTAIQSHQRDDINPFLPNSIYGSLNYRMKKSKLASSAKAIFWYQGESNATAQYGDFFRALYEDWKLDYPNVKKYYVVQIHHGCGTGDNSGVREVLRALPFQYSDIQVMSTNNLPDHDGCHFLYTGYNVLADWLFPLVQRDFYGGKQESDMDAPNLLQAFYSNNQRNEIGLLFGSNQQNLIIGKDTTVRGVKASLLEYFAFDGIFTNIKAIRTSKDTAFLSLMAPSVAKFLTYLPEVNYHNSQIIYQGPYITNARGIGALSFYNVPIRNKISTNTNYITVLPEAFGHMVCNNNDCYLSVQCKRKFTKLHLEIVDIEGKIVYSKFIPELEIGENKINIDLSLPISMQIFWRLKNEQLQLSGR